jgi:osmotically-inducible protein OsmY
VVVAVSQGIATLSGTVSNVLASKRALDVAETIRGVRSVVDTVTVTPIARTDDQLKGDVTSALRNDVATKPFVISVAAKDGRVTLSGAADSWEQRHLFEDVAEGVPGVASLTNDVTLHYSAARSDAEILTDVKHRLANDVWLDGDVFDVTVNGPTVRLSGVVGSAAEKSRARDDAWVAGAGTVVDEGVIVDWFSRNDQRHIADFGTRSDAEIAQGVRDALRIDPRLATPLPLVAVQNGAVTLSGGVGSAKARLAAAADAKNTWGVWSVRDTLLVQPSSSPSDADLEREATRLLKDDLLFSDGQPIRVSSAKGKVTLRGTLGSGFDRFAALEDVESLPGVAEIDDELVVKRPPPDIQAAIEDQLFWDPMVERDRVTVTVAPDGVATLTGTLDSWGEIKAAADDAMLGGAARVTNLLKLRNYPEVAAP